MRIIKLLDYNRWYEKIVYYNCKLNKKGKLGKMLSLINNVLIRIFFNCDISPSAYIGKNVKIPHAVGIVIGSTAIIGESTIIMPNVVIGSKYYPPVGEKRHATIGGNCVIGANSLIIGDLNIGNKCIIGAGSIVTEDMEENTKFINKRIIL